MTIRKNRRAEERVKVELPVRLDNASGITRDVSASGISFEVDRNFTPESEISFIIEMDAFDNKMLLKCKGSIVRTEAGGEKIGVAVKIIESVMQAAH